MGNCMFYFSFINRDSLVYILNIQQIKWINSKQIISYKSEITKKSGYKLMC